MILSFNIEYRTNWGEEVRISGLFPESIPLHTTDGIIKAHFQIIGRQNLSLKSLKKG